MTLLHWLGVWAGGVVALFVVAMHFEMNDTEAPKSRPIRIVVAAVACAFWPVLLAVLAIVWIAWMLLD